ncbi:MAG: CaiB/BaiF CoA transferase family protein [Micromonosporaceae bacterium]
MHPPLAGVRVLSLAEQYPGPYATAILADLGADVVQVERPGTGDPTRAHPGFHEALSRGKRSVVLDLKHPQGRDAFLALVARADAVLEGFRPGTMARLGLGPDTLREVNDHLVQVSVSGFGQDGPYRDRPGHDLSYQALAGTLYGQLGGPELPVPTTLELGDLAAGLLAVQAVLLGLVRRGRDGCGSYIDVSMFDGLVSLLSAHLGPVVNDAGPPGFPHEPGYAVFRTQDGKLLALSVAHENHFWRALCAVVGLPGEEHLPAASRLADAGRLTGLIAGRLATRPRAEWTRLLAGADVPYGEVRELADIPADPHVSARSLLVTVAGDDGRARRFVRQPLVVDGQAWGPRAGPPALGQHTAAVLREAGFSAGAISALAANGAVRCAAATAGDPS